MNKAEERKTSEESAAKKFDVMEEEVKAYIKEKVKDDNKASLGENNVVAKKIDEDGKAFAQAKKKKKEESTPWNFSYFIPPGCQCKERID